ncbi:cytochrome P450 [Nonomuraea sp. SMC257]|uniref:Cytochrome P450 n=1 Tax=Nonomuraea montanisoli TaxID=2741721 RepID=A0A7Y6IBT5_9ACTN|nr:cytochrome P450 [Nonomuraea montanisoli]NUW34615.1 cytochrome P450 [Nonomuraea montanisoli]
MSARLPLGVLFSPEFGADPYAVYASLREQGPVHPIDMPPGVGGFLVLDYEHGRALLNDPRLSKDLRNAGDYYRELAEGGDIVFSPTMLTVDPPDHTRLRRLVSKAFTARRVEGLRPRVEQITRELIATMAVKDEAELIDEFALPLPIIVICELLGVPAADRADFRALSGRLITPGLSEEARRERREAAHAMRDYFRAVIADRRAAPQDDLVSALITVRDDDTLLTEDELLSTLSLLLIAGHETTVNLIGNGVLALLRHPGQLALLRARPELLPSAIEEFLRYDGPVDRAMIRIAMEDLEITGTPIPKGSVVHVSLGAADHDPAVFPEPDRLDITRGNHRHLGFGHGIHFCVGAPLARLEGRIAFGSLLSAFPRLALACPPEELRWRHNGGIVRGLESLPVRLR